MSQVSDHVAMRLWQEAYRVFVGTYSRDSAADHKAAAAALSSHGLRELIDANEHSYQALMGKHDRQDAVSEQRKLREPAALLGEPPTVKGEK